MLHPVFLMAALSAVVVGRARAKPPAFFLAGDSTTAIDGGWGDGLLATLKSPAWGANIGKSGATTASFRAGGYWANVTQHLKDNVAKFDSYVTISVRTRAPERDRCVLRQLSEEGYLNRV